jgi:hypothetical protein
MSELLLDRWSPADKTFEGTDKLDDNALSDCFLVRLAAKDGTLKESNAVV